MRWLHSFLLFFALPGSAIPRDVLVFGGTPSYRAAMAAWVRSGDEIGVQTHILERPGFGDAPVQERTFENWRAFVTEYVTKRSIAEFAVVGISGGGPHALACAAIPGCKKIVLVSTAGRYLALMEASYLSEFSRQVAQLARQRDRVGLAKLIESRPGFERDPVAFKHGMLPTVDELILICGDWPFRLADIDCEVLAFHGTSDTLSSVSVVDDLEREIRHFGKRIYSGRGHDIGRSSEERIEILKATQK